MKNKYVLPFASNDGRYMNMELCCFCKKLKNLCHPGNCKHYEDDYEDNSCIGFVKVDNVSKRVEEILDCRCGKLQE